MQSILQKYSYSGVTLWKLDNQAAIEALKVSAQKLIETRDDVNRVILFGSLAAKKAVPGSDADILIVLEDSNIPLWFERIDEFETFFSGIRMPIELFPYTKSETTSIPFARTALEEGIVLAER